MTDQFGGMLSQDDLEQLALGKKVEDFLTPQKAKKLIQAVEKEDSERSLYSYTKHLWKIIEQGRRYQDNWHIHAICDHLEAVKTRQIKRLIINIPFRCMKSILTSVALPTWVWGPGNQPGE